MRTNSIISDPLPQVPATSGIPDQPKAKPNDFEKIVSSSKYPQFAEYVQQRIDYYKSFTPGGTPVTEISDKQRAVAWGQSIVVIREFEQLLAFLNASKR